MKIPVTFLLLHLAIYGQTQESGCFEYQTKNIYHNFDREILNFPRQFSTIEACQVAMSKIKTGRNGSSTEVQIVKSCGACERTRYTRSGSNSGGDSGSNSGGNPKKSSPESGSSSPGKTATPKHSTPDSPPASRPGSPNPNTTSPPGNNTSRTDKPSLTAAPASDEEKLAKTIVEASQGIQNAIRQYEAEKQWREAQSPNYDTKPEGFQSSEVYENEWVIAPVSGTLEQTPNDPGTWQQDLENLWDDVKDLFGLAARSTEVLGIEQPAPSFGSVSGAMQYLETAGKLDRLVKSPGDYENRAALVQDAFDYTAEYTGAAGAGFGKFAPPVDLYKRTFEGAFSRMNSLVTSGDAGDELQVTAPVADWFGSMFGMGKIGTRERNYRMEGYMSFSELKDRHGYIEAAKQKVYNWLHH